MMLTKLFANFTKPFTRKRGPRILIFGDSHIDALQRAIKFEGRSEEYRNVEAYRVRKIKSGKAIGDIDLKNFCRKIRRLDEGDYVISLVGGNQYAVVSTIKLEPPADVIDRTLRGSADELRSFEGTTIIPRQALKSYIGSGVWNSDGPVLRRLKASTKAQIIHLIPPPPKEDNEFIRNSHETFFVSDSEGAIDPTDPSFRLKCWHIQKECLAELCEDVGVGLLNPPPNTISSDGYLARAYYGADVTHANRRYGDQALRQVIELIAATEANWKGSA